MTNSTPTLFDLPTADDVDQYDDEDDDLPIWSAAGLPQHLAADPGDAARLARAIRWALANGWRPLPGSRHRAWVGPFVVPGSRPSPERDERATVDWESLTELRITYWAPWTGQPYRQMRERYWYGDKVTVHSVRSGLGVLVALGILPLDVV